MTSITVVKLAEMYYPKLWGDNRIDALVKAGKLTAEDAVKIRAKSSEK